jgi:hypothetical protein
MPKLALISSIEPKENGYRVAQIIDAADRFPVGEPNHFWVECPDDVVADAYWYDPTSQSFAVVPIPEVLAQPTPEDLQAQLTRLQAQIESLAGNE